MSKMVLGSFLIKDFSILTSRSNGLQGELDEQNGAGVLCKERLLYPSNVAYQNKYVSQNVRK